jgi:hypothetical protein
VIHGGYASGMWKIGKPEFCFLLDILQAFVHFQSFGNHLASFWAELVALKTAQQPETVQKVC